jgi:adenylate cyclase class 2
MKGHELEVKFYITDLPRLEGALQELGAQLEHPRVHEVNLRFDTPDSRLDQTFQVLRLRQDDQARLTYKGPSETLGGARLRREIEFSVSDFAAARELLEALGYRVSMMYEKFRTTYALHSVHITLDELPYGSFVELEGGEPESIRQAGRALDLRWERRVVESYTGLFDAWKARAGQSFQDLSFANFRELPVTAADLGVQPGDAAG